MSPQGSTSSAAVKTNEMLSVISGQLGWSGMFNTLLLAGILATLRGWW